jgi:two-component system sensor histidine kinase UhpB
VAPAAEPPARRSRWRSDLWWVVAATVGCYFVASAFELQESLSHRLARFESWQADELPLSVTVLACGLAWYALRRRREAEAQLALREQAEARVADLLVHNRELAQRLISVQESERLALARELHDELGQSCTAIRVETAYLRHCAADDRVGMLAAAARADATAQDLYRLVRDMLCRLRPANLDTLGLGAALQELCESWAARTGVDCSFQVEGSTLALGDDLDITIYRVAQEALTNVARHARAGRVRVTLARPTPARVTLSVHDDGLGMDLGAATRGLGLLGAVERAAAVGGELQVRSAPGAGVQIELSIPLPPAPPVSGTVATGLASGPLARAADLREAA